ncbi:hypothetical protein GCM10009863_67730 [Streptomyces axinellae]|uniref:Uncharacterized protein n=1 Tax=Streptomyces axinellae TaxID=552788 RepID=A0ABP6DC16_9ACTN
MKCGVGVEIPDGKIGKGAPDGESEGNAGTGNPGGGSDGNVVTGNPGEASDGKIRAGKPDGASGKPGGEIGRTQRNVKGADAFRAHCR